MSWNTILNIFFFFYIQDEESWSRGNSQDENDDCTNNDDKGRDCDKSSILGNEDGPSDPNDDDSGHDVDENDEGDDFNDDDQSSTKPISRIQNQHIFSQLAAKMFPGMKGIQNEGTKIENKKSSKFPNVNLKVNSTKVSDLKATALNSFELAKRVPIGGGVSSQLLNGRLKELEDEITRFKKENEVISQQKKENGDYLKLLKKELAGFEMKKKMEKEEFETYKISEIQKLKRDRKIFENYKTNQENGFTRETRKEIDSLRNQLEEVKNTLKEKEKKHQMGVERWKERVGVLEDENGGLKDELVLREKDRCDLVKQINALKMVEIGGLSPRSILTKKSSGGGGERSGYKSSNGGENRLKIFQNTEINEVIGGGDRIKNYLTNIDYNFDNVDNVDRFKDGERLNQPTINHSELELKYLKTATNNATASHEATTTHDTTTTTEIVNRTILPDGSCRINYSNGTTKTTHPDAHTTTTYFNQDTKETFPDGRTIYFYANSKTKHHTFPDCTEIYYFQSGQTEKHYPVGTREVTFPDGTIKYIDPHSNSEETIFTDGSWLKVNSSGETEMEFANGQREIHRDTYRRREYPDGTSKTVFNDGTQETKYSSGRVRIKDASGNVIFDGVKE